MRVDPIRLGLLWGLVLQLSACEPGGELLAPPTPPDEPPPPANAEQALAATDAPELFPVAEGDDVIFLRPRSVAEEDTDPPDCLATPYSSSCIWDVVHVNIATNAERVLHEETDLKSIPRINHGRVYWLRDGGDSQRETVIHDLHSGTQRVVDHGTSYYMETNPVLQGSSLYWLGRQMSQSKRGLHRASIDGGPSALLVEARYFNNPIDLDSSLARLAEHDSIVATDEWVAWTGREGSNRTVERYWLESNKREYLHKAKYLEAFGLTHGDGWLAWKLRDRSQDCWDSNPCAIQLSAYIFGVGLVDRTPAAGSISQYASLLSSNESVFWADYRDGPYAIFGADVFGDPGNELRYTSEAAIVGTAVTPTATDTHLVWNDWRNGNWDIFIRPL